MSNLKKNKANYVNINNYVDFQRICTLCVLSMHFQITASAAWYSAAIKLHCQGFIYWVVYGEEVPPQN